MTFWLHTEDIKTIIPINPQFILLCWAPSGDGMNYPVAKFISFTAIQSGVIQTFGLLCIGFMER